MNSIVQFSFRNKVSSCNVFIDSSEDPCYVFAILLDQDLINEFGDEVTIKTDCEKRLPKKDDYAQLVELRDAIFDAVKTIPEFIAAKNELMLLSQTLSRSKELISH